MLLLFLWVTTGHCDLTAKILRIFEKLKKRTKKYQQFFICTLVKALSLDNKRKKEFLLLLRKLSGFSFA